MKTPIRTIALGIATFGLAATAPAFAGSTQHSSHSVSIAGLDLSTVEGQRMLDRRINGAARTVCQANGIPSGGAQIRSFATRQCVAKAKASARSQVAIAIENQQRGG